MKVVSAIAGVFTGLALYAVGCYGGRALDRYAEPKIPPYTGPKYRTWKDGVPSGSDLV